MNVRPTPIAASERFGALDSDSLGPAVHRTRPEAAIIASCSGPEPDALSQEATVGVALTARLNASEV